MSRLAEILGVEENEVFRIFEDDKYEYKVCDGELRYKNRNVWREWHDETDIETLYEIINHPEKIIRKTKLTDKQITAIKGRIAEGFEWVVYWSCEQVMFEDKQPTVTKDVYISRGEKSSSAYADFYPFCKFGEPAINLKELLKENGVEV